MVPPLPFPSRRSQDAYNFIINSLLGEEGRWQMADGRWRMKDEVRPSAKQCPTCQSLKKKKKKKKYGKFLPRNVELNPCDTVCNDLVSPYTVTGQKVNNEILDAMAFVNPGTGWFEIAEINHKTSARISQIFVNTWLSHYLRPRKVIFDNENEFMKDFLHLLKAFSSKHTPTTIKNPQTNIILEKVHQVPGNMLRTKNLQKYDFDEIGT